MTLFREVRLDLTQEIEVLHMLFEKCRTKNSTLFGSIVKPRVRVSASSRAPRRACFPYLSERVTQQRAPHFIY